MEGEGGTYADGSGCTTAQAASTTVIGDAVGPTKECEVVVPREHPILLSDAGVTGP
jgi:hypothetical protein